MRTLLLIFSVSLFSCSTVKYRPRVLPIALAAASGAAYGFHETIVHHPHQIPEKWNKQWWDGTISWRNKYALGDPANGPKFFGSTTFLAWSTDGKHLFGTMHRATLFGAGVTITIGEKRQPKHILADIGLSFAAFSLGFHSVYTLGFR